MSDVRALYARLGVDLPDRGGNELAVSCFANPEAHRHGDRNASASVNRDSGVWCCHACGAGGGAYDAALALGTAPAEAMRLLEEHGFTNPAPAAPARRPTFTGTEEDVAAARATLASNRTAIERLGELRGWTAEAVERLELGLDGRGLVTFPIREAGGALVGLLRYQPNKERRSGPKLKADAGSRRELFPRPEAVEGEPVYLVEGEGDAVAGASLGLAAVAVPGAGKWDASWTPRFASRRVVLCFDSDAVGRTAADRAQAALLGHVAELRRIDLDPSADDGTDLGDWTLEASRNGGLSSCRHALEQAVEHAPPLSSPAATEASDAGELLEAAESFIRRYVVPPGAHELATLALFTLHSHAVSAAHSTPYLIVLSPERRTGKTLLLEVIELIVARAWRIVAVSEAAMFRKIAQDRPTVLLDEVDAIFGSNSERTEPLRALLNAGNRPGSAVARCVGQGELRVVDFEVFGPKVLAGIDTGRLPDTIRDRGVEIRMKRKTSAEHVERFRVRHAAPVAEELRERLSQWAEEATTALREAEPDLPESLNDRAAEAWEPLLAIADSAGGEWPRRARAAAVALAAGAELEEVSSGTRVLAKLAELLSDRPVVSTEQSLEAINADEELPFGGWRDGRGLDARGLARQLRPYGLRPRTVKLPDGSTAKGYHRDARVEEAFARYLPRPSTEPSPPSPEGRPSAHSRAEVTQVTQVTDLSGMTAK